MTTQNSAQTLLEAVEYEVIPLGPSDIEPVYRNLYCKNNVVIDEYVSDTPILPITKYDKVEFIKLMEDKTVFAFLLTQKIMLSSPNAPKYYYTNDKKGILCFEANKQAKEIEIFILEAENHKYEMYSKLLSSICKKIIDKNKETGNKIFKTITAKVPDNAWNQLKALMDNGFRRTKTISDNTGEWYLYERNI